AVNGVTEHVLSEPGEEVIVRRHQAEGVALEELRARELGDQLHAGVVVTCLAEDVLLVDRPSGDVEKAGVLGTHVASVPGYGRSNRNDSVKTREPGSKTEPGSEVRTETGSHLPEPGSWVARGALHSSQVADLCEPERVAGRIAEAGVDAVRPLLGRLGE